MSYQPALGKPSISFQRATNRLSACDIEAIDKLQVSHQLALQKQPIGYQHAVLKLSMSFRLAIT